MDKNGEPLDVKIVKVRDIDQRSEIYADDGRVSLLPTDDPYNRNKQTLKGSLVLKELKEF